MDFYCGAPQKQLTTHLNSVAARIPDNHSQLSYLLLLSTLSEATFQLYEHNEPTIELSRSLHDGLLKILQAVQCVLRPHN